MCISLFCNCINYLPNQFTQIISNLRNWDEKPVQFFFHDLLMDFHSVKPNILIQIFLFRIQFLEVKCPKSVRCQQKHLWHTIGCNKENPSKRVTECNKRTREKYQNKNRRHFFAATIQGTGRSNMVLTVDRATKGCSKVFNMSGNMCFPNQSIVMLQTVSRLQILCR